MGDLICINDSFTPEQIAVIPNRVMRDSLYTPREIFRISNGEWAVRLNEIENPLLKDEFTGQMFEPSFSLKRFNTLSGFPPSEEEIKQFIKDSKTIKI